MPDQVFAVYSGFYDAINEDRTYTADQMNRPYRRLVSNGVFATPAGTPSTDLQVTSAGSGMRIIVSKGEGIFDYKWFENPAAISITVPPNTGVARRIDSVIAQIDKRVSGRVGNIVFRAGVPSSNPTPPAINTLDNVVEYRLANIDVAAGASAITDMMITDCRGSDECPWVTNLIYQVDTSTLWRQYQDAYQDFYDDATQDFEQYTEEQREAWEQFLETLTEELSVSTNVLKLTNTVVTTADGVNVPIGIPSYEPGTDVLEVYINGLHAAAGVAYTVNQAGTGIILKAPLLTGQVVNFVVYKSVISAAIDSAVTLIQRLEDKLSSFMSDTGWIEMQPEGSVTAYNQSLTPAVRYIGGRTYVRGAVKGVSSAGVTLCTLPVSCRPAVDHIYAAPVVSGASVQSVASLRISAATGRITLDAISSGVSSGAMISIATSFLAESGYTQEMLSKYMGTVNTYGDLPENPDAGDVYQVQEADPTHGITAGESVMWNGAEWEKVYSSLTSADIDEIISSIE